MGASFALSADYKSLRNRFLRSVQPPQSLRSHHISPSCLQSNFFISDHIYLILLLKLQPIRDKAIGHCNGNEKNWESSFVREDEAVGARAWGVVSGAL